MVPKEGRLAIVDYLPASQTYVTYKRFRLAQAIAAGADDDLELADFTECDFDGYAEIQDPAFEASSINVDERGEIETELLTWTAGAGIAAPQTIVGVYLVVNYSLGGDRLLAFWRVSPTVTLVNQGEVFSRIVRILADDLGV